MMSARSALLVMLMLSALTELCGCGLFQVATVTLCGMIVDPHATLGNTFGHTAHFRAEFLHDGYVSVMEGDATIDSHNKGCALILDARNTNFGVNLKEYKLRSLVALINGHGVNGAITAAELKGRNVLADATFDVEDKDTARTKAPLFGMPPEAQTFMSPQIASLEMAKVETESSIKSVGASIALLGKTGHGTRQAL